MTHEHLCDPTFPTLHPGRPARGWVNDPNGLLRHDGRWHVFFQHNPDATVHDAIHWGHVSSGDLVTWREEPVALRPQPGGPDSRGCWTGCATVEDGVPTLVYSGVTDTSGSSSVLLARSDGVDDGLTAWKQDAAPAAGMPDDPATTDVRDPFLFEHDGHRYAVQGAGSPGGRPSLLVYDADELTSWRLLGTLLDDTDPVVATAAPAHIWECPNLVRVEGSGSSTWLLVLSLWRQVDGTHDLAGVRWFTGDLEVVDGVPRFRPATHGELDRGPTFYAPQLLSDGDRVLAWGWAWEHERSDAQVAAAGWAGTLTFPRELLVVDGRVVSRPAAELASLRRAALPDGEPLAGAFEVQLALGPGELWLDHPGGQRERVLTWSVPSEAVTDARLLVDGSVVELFGCGPEAVTTRAYPRAGSTWRVSGERLGAWSLGLPPSP